jgi:hypothetical protein
VSGSICGGDINIAFQTMHGEKKECPISRCFSGATGKRTVRNEKQMVSNAEEQ